MSKKRETVKKEERPQNILIEKAQVNNPRLSEDMEKILNSIVGEIRNCPPAQPRRKYQKAIDMELKMSHNTRLLGDIRQDILRFSDTISTKSHTTINTDKLTKETAFDKKSSDKQILSKSKEMEERNSDTESNLSDLSTQKVSKEDNYPEINNTSEETKEQETNKSEIQADKQLKQLQNIAIQSNKWPNNDEITIKTAEVKQKPALKVKYSKFHLGDGMIAKKIPPKTVIDLDDDN